MTPADRSSDTRLWRRPAAILGAIFLAATVHCGSSTSSSSSGDAPSTSPGAGAADGAARSDIDAGSASPAPGAADNVEPNASGVIVVHASANMQGFRLCFGNDGIAGNLLPLPDRELMPQSNLVGVDVGSAVRLRPLADVGLTLASNGGKAHTVYAIPEKYLRPPQRPANTPCSALICPGLGGDCLDANQFYTLNALPQAIYQDGVHLLVLSGCIPGSGDIGRCGPDFDVANGNAKLTAIDLSTFTHKKSDDFLVQYAQLSPALSGQTIRATFGDQSAKGTPFNVSSTFAGISPQAPLTLAFDRNDAQVYASHGFHLDVGGLAIDQSLAAIQALSAPQALPEEFYSTRSNFVLLLLGDPADTSPTGGPKTPTTDPGRVVHLLAVPVAKPSENDGGVDAGPYDGGVDAGTNDGGKSDASDAGGPG